jgi:transcriptional regulator with XRE-family HTH domain
MSVKSINLNILNKFCDLDYRSAFLESRLADEVAHNIKLLREKNDLRQKDLADRSGTKQTAISRIERSEEANWNIKTLFRLALALDHRLKIIFQPLDEAIKEFSSDFAEDQIRPTRQTSLSEKTVLDEIERKPQSAKDIAMYEGSGRLCMSSFNAESYLDRQRSRSISAIDAFIQGKQYRGSGRESIIH